jgi:hypothetical protein
MDDDPNRIARLSGGDVKAMKLDSIRRFGIYDSAKHAALISYGLR